MSKLGLMIDYEYCTGCQSCEIACKNEHGFPLDKWGIKMMEFGPIEMDGEVGMETTCPSPPASATCAPNASKRAAFPPARCIAWPTSSNGLVDELARKT